jgi:hypothetical protein
LRDFGVHRAQERRLGPQNRVRETLISRTDSNRSVDPARAPSKSIFTKIRNRAYIAPSRLVKRGVTANRHET